MTTSTQTAVQDIDHALPKRELVLATVVVALFIMLGEIDRLISRVSSLGYAASMADASAPRVPVPVPTSESRPWLTLHNLGAEADRFVVVFTAVDSTMALFYGALLFGLLRTLQDRQVIGADAPVRLFTTPRPWLAWTAVGFDLLENTMLQVIVQLGEPGRPMLGALPVVACAATFLKWSALVLAIAPLLYALSGTLRGRQWAGRWGQALFRQRFSVLAVLPIAAIALVPGPGILDQLPDIQRAWLEVGRDRGWTGLLHAGVATAVLGVTAFGLFLLGRMFTDLALHRSTDTSGRPRAMLRQWLFGPVVVVVAASGVMVVGGEVRLVPLVVFLAVPLVIVAASWWLRRRHHDRFPVPPAGDALPVSQIWRAGDVLALAGLVVASLALVRSHTVLLILWEGNLPQRLMPFLGLAAAVAVWGWGTEALRWVGGTIPLVRELIEPSGGAHVALTTDDAVDGHAPQSTQQRRPWLLAWVCIWASTITLVAIVAWPVQLAPALGVLGAVMVGLGNLMLLVGASAVVHSMYAPPEIFWTRMLRLREAPVATLLTATVLAASMTGSTPEVHGLRPSDGGAAGTTPDAAVAAWSERTSGCLVTLPDGGTARPLLFIAAEGGGIRAAYWTAAVLDVLARETPCGTDAVVLASGVSGGSVGLAVARVAGVADGPDVVWRMGDADALSQASLGLLVRDPVNVVTGIPAQLDGGWVDRAGLMERAWEAADAGLAQDFYAIPAAGGLAAPLVLNSTDATSGCRVLVTHLEVGGDVDAAARCTDATAPLAYSRDIRTYMRQGATASVDDACIEGLRTSTAAMLSARFPYVTPSGVIGPCGETPRAQLIDGGYAEGSGLGSLVDLAPSLLRLLPDDGAPVLPIIAFLDNGRGGDLLPIPPQARPELLVPPLGALTAGATQNSTAAWLQRARVLSAGPNVLPPEVFVVAQGSAPAVEAPLGWVLSGASASDMDDSLEAHRARACSAEEPADSQSQNHPNLPELLDLLGACEGS